VADLDLAAAEECAGSIIGLGHLARAISLDVTDVEAVRGGIARVDAETPLRTVVANAGVAFQRPLLEVEPEPFDRLMEVNVRGVFFTLQAAARAMAPRGAGSIVTVCSTSGFTASRAQHAPALAEAEAKAMAEPGALTAALNWYRAVFLSLDAPMRCGCGVEFGCVP